MGRLSLVDVVRPYVVAAATVPPEFRQVLELLHVDEYDTAVDEDAVVFWGVARIDDSSTGLPALPTSRVGGAVTFEAHDLAVRFRLTAARRPAAAVTPAQFADPTVAAAVTAMGADTPNTRSDFPGTQFRLDLMFELVTATLHRFVGAKVAGAFLVADPDHPVVKLQLPRITLRLVQDSAAETDLDVSLASWGAETIDDSDPAVGALLRMTPTYAIDTEGTFGFGLEKAVLDVSDQRTPPDVLDRFGLGDDWQGIYLPELRFFFADEKASGTAANVGVRDLMLGFAPEVAIWGDLSFDVDFRGDALAVGLRLYGVDGARIDPTPIRPPQPAAAEAAAEARYQVTVPSTAGPETENYLLYVDVKHGAAPFVITAVTGEDHPTDLDTFPGDAFFDDPANSPQDLSVVQRVRLFSHDQRVAIRVTSRNTAQRRVIVLDVYPDRQAVVPRLGPPPPNDARLENQAGDSFGSFEIVRPQSGTDVTVAFTPPDPIAVTADGSSVTVTGGRATVPVNGGESIALVATWQRTTEGELGRVTAYFEFDKPVDPSRGGTVGDVREAVGGPLLDFAVSPAAKRFVETWNGRDQAQPKPRVRLDGYASREAAAQHDYNRGLADRRIRTLRRLILEAGIAGLGEADIEVIPGWGNDGHPLAPGQAPPADPRLVVGQTPGNQSAEAASSRGNTPGEEFRIAVASIISPTVSTATATADLVRDAPDTPDRAPDPPPPATQQPDFLRAVGGTVRWEREPVPVAGELRLTVDFKTAHEQGLQEFRDDIETVRPGLEPAEEARLPQAGSVPNPDDGVVEARLTVVHDPATGAFAETLVARAAATDRDGLWSWGTIPAADAPGEPVTDPWRDILGLYFTLAPLTAGTAAGDANDGEVVPLVVALATPVVVTTLGVAHVLRITHYGVELAVRHDADEVHGALLFDVESAVWLDLRIGDFEIVTTRPDKPVKVRYKAVGFGLDLQPGQPTRFLPVFDSARGYTVDLADSGSLRVLPSLGGEDLIQVLGARIARTNPLNLEVELGLGVDLGVFTVDTFGFRLPIDPPGRPTITAIGVGVDIPNAINGSGYLEILATGFAGQLDLTLPTVGLRIAGGLRIQEVTEGGRTASGVLVTVAAEFPGGVPLGGTGLSLYGILGLFAMHHRRLEDPQARNPALSWLIDTVHGDPTRVEGWGPALDAWAVGVGIVAGTIEDGSILNLKGMLVLELPGPRIVLFVKANLLTKRRPTREPSSGALFAVVDISPERMLIGIQVDYEIEGILELHVPTEAGFFSDRSDHFYLDVGTISAPARGRVLDLFDATAYLMVHGDGIPDFPLVPGGLRGYSLAAGFKVSIVWGDTDVGLYLKASGGFDAGLAFVPFYFAGKVYFDGSLHLFIVSIDAHAELTLTSDGDDTLFTGRVCGKVSFFFFSVKGCVGFELGTDPGAPDVPQPLRDVTLQSRSPALVQGTAVDRGVDTVLCHATADGSVPRSDDGAGGTVETFVPIDAVPIVQFEVAPLLATGAVDGTVSGGLPAGEQGGWQRRGPNYLRYRVSRVELQLVTLHGVPPAPGTPPVTDGPRPYTWRHDPQQGGSDGLPVDLALLSWLPTNAGKAILEGDALDAIVDDRWGGVCVVVAEPARVLWTFRHERLGPSDDGWNLVGEAWPDDPGTVRSQPVDTTARIRETWRTGTLLDGLLPHKPAAVVGIASPCPGRLTPPAGPRPPTEDRPIDRAGRRPHGRGPLDALLATLPEAPVDPDAAEDAAADAASAADAAESPARPGRQVPIPLGAGPTGGARAAAFCRATVLEAPFEVSTTAETGAGPTGLPEGFLGTPMATTLQEIDGLSADRPRDVVRISGGPHRELTLLVAARPKMVDKGLFVVSALDAAGQPVDGVTVSFDSVSGLGDLPATWTTPAGPWHDDVALALAFFGGLLVRGLDLFLVKVLLPRPALHVDLGVRPLDVAVEQFGMRPPSWYLAVVEGLSEREVLRWEDDSGEADDDAGGLGDALDNPGHALLLPDAEYRVLVHYDGEVGRRPLDPEEGQDPDEIVSLRSAADVVQRTFFTDAEPPRSLDPWLLAQFPAPDEPYHFYEDPVVIVFATDDVLELFAAYDRTLRAVARAASFRGSAGTPEEPLTHLPLGDSFEVVGALVVSPWEATVRRRIGARTCGDFDPDSDGHGRTALPFPLDPLTDYVLDLEALRPDGTVDLPSLRPGEVGNRPRYRQRFTTSRYASRAELASAVRTTRFVTVRVPDPAPLDALADIVTDETLDIALLDSGLNLRPRPTAPELRMLWRPDEPATPLAFLIETPEPLWRSRLEPAPTYDSDGHILRWTLERAEWLGVDELVPTTPTPVTRGGAFVQRATGLMTAVAPRVHDLRYRLLHPGMAPLPPPLPPSVIARFVHDESGCRTLVFLFPAARGRSVTLGLRRRLHPLLDEDTTDIPVVLCESPVETPPWEEP